MAEQIIQKLREAEIALAQGLADGCSAEWQERARVRKAARPSPTEARAD